MRTKRTFMLALAVILSASGAFGQRPGPPDPPPLGRVVFPEYETRVLDNGLRVYALEHREQPVVAIRLLIAAGAANDPADLSGTASLTASLLSLGAGPYGAAEFADAVDFTGGSLSASADMESTTVVASFLRDHAPFAMELIATMILDPTFDPEEIDRLKQQSYSGLAASMEEPDFIADAVLARFIYGEHPYGRLTGGTLGSIPAIEPGDITAFHDRFYAPNISAISMVGDLSTDEMFALAERYLGAWSRKDVPAPPGGNPPQASERRIVVIDRPGSVQTEIRVGQLIVPRKDPDYFNVLMASLVLGGSAESRLNQRLRVERGLTYGAFSTVLPQRGPGSFSAMTDTRTERTAEAVTLMLDELEGMRTASVPAEELDDAKALVIGGFPLTIETPASLANRLSMVFLYDLGDDYLDTYRDRLAAVTDADVLRVSREILRPEDTVVVLVGDAAAFRAEIEPLGDIEVIPADRLDLDAPALATD